MSVIKNEYENRIPIDRDNSIDAMRIITIARVIFNHSQGGRDYGYILIADLVCRHFRCIYISVLQSDLSHDNGTADFRTMYI